MAWDFAHAERSLAKHGLEGRATTRFIFSPSLNLCRKA
jgi:hypothetical protein